MATKPATAVKEKEPETQARPTTQVAITPRTTMESLPAHLRMDVEEYAGAGTSDRREDNLVPFLYIAQKSHPQVNKRDPSYIEGLEPGMVFDTSTRQIWHAEEAGGGPKMIQAHFERQEVEWGMRGSADKGYKGRHPSDTPLLSEVREVPKESGRGVYRIIKNGHQLVTTAYHYMILARELRPVALALSSSGLQASRTLNTNLRNKKLRSARGLVVAPSFSTLLQLRTVWVQDGEFDWFVPVLEDLGWVIDEYLDAYEEAKALHLFAIQSGVRVAEPPAEDGSAPASDDRADDRSDPDANPADDSPI